jgi:hypothetical protein
LRLEFFISEASKNARKRLFKVQRSRFYVLGENNCWEVHGSEFNGSTVDKKDVPNFEP